MPNSTYAKNLMLDALPNTVYVSAHDSNPGDTGLNEISGGSYARQSMTIAAATGSARDSSSQPAVPIPAGTTVTHTGIWDAASGGNFLGYAALSASETFSNAGTLTVTDADFLLS